MQLEKFRVRNFRSVEDSGWIQIDRVASLIGINESGKTDLLLPLWKLNSAGGGEIRPTADYPRKLYNELREAEPKPVFVEAYFRADERLATQLSGLTARRPNNFERSTSPGASAVSMEFRFRR